MKSEKRKREKEREREKRIIDKKEKKLARVNLRGNNEQRGK